MIKDTMTFYYFAFPIILLTLMIIFLDRKAIQSLFWFGMVWGAGGSFVFVVIFSNIFTLFKYKHIEPFTFFGLPVLLGLAWTPAILLFLHFLPNRKTGYPYYAYITAFSLLSAVNDELFYKLGLLEYIHWHAFFRFIISLPYFYWMAIHYEYLKEKGVFEAVG